MIVFVLIDVDVDVEDLDECFFHVHNISIEYLEDDLHVYFWHELHHLIHYNVDEMIHSEYSSQNNEEEKYLKCNIKSIDLKTSVNYRFCPS